MSSTPADPLIGSTISQYEVVALIGGGGMGVVYKAIDTKLGRAVALKFLPPQWSHDEGAKQRFLREAQAASATNHRNICIIHDIEQTDDGRLFIVMAYYEGQTLKQKLEDGPLPFTEALEIAAEAAEGLAKAHAQGVVHRDVKPGNLMITDDGVKVLDFGLAKFADSLQLTMPGSTIGTVAYMSPEQARGEEADARSDVWALGVVLYEMLTGRVPFNGAYPEAIFHAIKNEQLPPISAERMVPPALESLVLRVLEKDPERRYQSARELARDLRLLQGRTVPLDLRTEPLPWLPPREPARPATWPQRVRRAVTPARAIVAVVAVAAVVAGTYAWLTRPVVRIPVAIAPVANHTGEPELDPYRLALTQSLITELGESPNIRVVRYLRLLQIVRRFIGAGDVSSSESIQAIAAESGARLLVVPSLEYRNGTWLAQVQIRNADTGAVFDTYETEAATSSLHKDAALRQIPLLADRIQEHFKANGPGRSYSRRPASARFRNLDAAKAFEEGLNGYEQLEFSAALNAFRGATSFDDQHAMSHAWLSRVSLILKQGNEAVRAARRAQELVTAETPRPDAEFVSGILAESLGDFQTAGQHYRRLSTLAADDAVASAEWADFLKRQYRNQEAIEASHDVLQLDAGYLRQHVELCQLYTRIPDYPLADQQARNALEKFRAAKNRAGEAQALLCLGELQRLQGRFEDATRNIEAAREIFESLGLQYGLSRVYQYLGAVAADARNYPAAVQLFEEALSRSRRVGNRELEGMQLTNLGVVHEAMGQRTKALDYYKQSHDLYQQMGEQRRAADADINVASLLVDAGSDQAEALRRATNARATLREQGSLEFEVIAMQVEAASHLYAGNHVEARRLLQMALSQATERLLSNRIVLLNAKLAESHFAMAEYERARALLEQIAATDTGRDSLEVAVATGRVLVRLGDFDGARTRLEHAARGIEGSGHLELLPRAHTALGELEYERRKPQEARGHFARAAALWADDLPDAASVEATCYLGLIDALAGKAVAGRAAVEKGLQQAKKMGRLSVEALCRLHQARIDLGQRRYVEATAALEEIPADGERTIGPELRANVHYWRSRVAAERGEPDSELEASRAQKLLQDVQASLNPAYSERFASRPDIQQILEKTPVQKPR